MQQGSIQTLTSGTKTALFYVYRYTEIPFVQSFKRVAIYGCAVSRQTISSTIGKGKESTIELRNNSFDYLAKLFLSLQLPDVIIPTNTTNYMNARFAWSRNIGNLLIDECVLKLGGTPICQTKSPLWIQIQSEIFNPFSKLQLLNKLQGNQDKFTSYDSPDVSTGRIKSQHLVIVDLPFTFSGDLEDALPMFLFDGLQPQVTFKLINEIRWVCLYNSVMSPYIDQLDITTGNYFPLMISIDESLKCHLRNEAKYYYVVKDVDCKTVSALNPSNTIKINQASTSTLTKAVIGAVKTGDFSGQTFLTYNFGDMKEKDICQNFADLLAQGMLYFQSPAGLAIGDLTLPPEWSGTAGSNIGNIFILDPTKGYIDRTYLGNTVPDIYLRIKAPAAVLAEYTIAVNMNALAPTSGRIYGNSNWNFCCKLDTIEFDCILATVGGVANTIVRPTFTATSHRVNIKDCSLCLTKCNDYRASAAKVNDVIVYDGTNTGVFVNGTGSWINEIKHVFLAYDRTLPNYDEVSDVEKLCCFSENYPDRKGMVVISHTTKLDGKSFANGVADYGKFESSELTLNLVSPGTKNPFLSSPFKVVDDSNAKSVFEYFMILVKAPLFISTDSLNQIVDENALMNFIDDSILAGNRFASTRVEEFNGANTVGLGAKKTQQKGKGYCSNEAPVDRFAGLSTRTSQLVNPEQTRMASQYVRQYPQGYPANIPYADLVNSSPCKPSFCGPTNMYSQNVQQQQWKQNGDCDNGSCSRPLMSQMNSRRY